MSEAQSDVLVAGYQDIDTAAKDFEALVARVKDKSVRVEGVILVTRDADGNVVVQQTGDNLGRKGMGWGGGVGFLVGLAAPPLLAATAVGGAAGGLIGKFAEHRLQTGIHDRIGENLPPGSAAIIATFDSEQRLGVQQALAGALAKSVVETDKKGIAALKVYDGDGNLTRIVRMDDSSNILLLTCFEYDGDGLVTATVESTDLQLPAEVDDPCTGNRREFEYNSYGNLVAVTDPRFSGLGSPPQTVFDPDIAGRAESVTDELSHTTSTVYDDFDKPLSVTDELGNTTGPRSRSGDLLTSPTCRFAQTRALWHFPGAPGRRHS